jgi:hypothetical protein
VSELATMARSWLAAARQAGVLEPRGLVEAKGVNLLYPRSVKRNHGATYLLLRLPGAGIHGPAHGRGKAIGVLGPRGSAARFEGDVLALDGGEPLLVGPLSHANAETLRRTLLFTSPAALAGQDVTIGVGDRLGVAGPGHLRLFARRGAAPVLAQQSVRELELTGRTYEEVLDAATWAVFQEGFARPWGADGDHLKTEDWVRRAVGVGFSMVTADVSDFIRKGYAVAGDDEIRSAYAALPESYRSRIEGAYLTLRLSLDTAEEVRFAPDTLARIALVYRDALEHAGRLYRAGEQAAMQARTGRSFDFELSVDETETPTTPEAHAFVALEAQSTGIRLASLAPRFVGEFQKGIDYIGDQGEFERSFRTHAALARCLGYRISVHSGSDKFRVFPAVGRLTGGRFHLKTAGTNWLEAVRLLAKEEPEFYRKLHRKALDAFAAATRYYHVTTNLARVPGLAGLKDEELPGLFDQPDARQLVHITYGELLRDPEFRGRFFSLLESHMESYWRALQSHIGRHLDALGVR